MALFDAFLPRLASRGLMFPLGGSSNHFRTAALRKVRGWDAWNVTEDADMGVRLARHGYGVAVIASSTFEEAPTQVAAWIYQRTRWMKGYILTWWLHACRPRRLLREVGLRHFLVFNALVGGAPLSALALPVLIVCFSMHLPVPWSAHTAPHLAILHAANMAMGFGAVLWLALLGVRRRGARGYLGALVWLPAYWLLISLATARALVQLAGAPHLWEKTEHRLPRGVPHKGPKGAEAPPFEDAAAEVPEPYGSV
jgi:hypothetical protein